MKINNYKLSPHQFGFSTTPQDSTSLFFAKVKGFNKSRLGFDELNVIMDYFGPGSNSSGTLMIHHFNYDSFPAYNLNKQFLINKLTTAKFGILRLAVEGNILQ